MPPRSSNREKIRALDLAPCSITRATSGVTKSSTANRPRPRRPLLPCRQASRRRPGRPLLARKARTTASTLETPQMARSEWRRRRVRRSSRRRGSATKVATQSGPARTSATAIDESGPWAAPPVCAAVATCGALAQAGCQPGAASCPRDNRRLFDHNAFSTGTSVATIETVPSTTTVITAARTAIPARRLHRPMRVRATSAPARTRVSSGAR
jgi:hypothetical protein